MIGGSDFILKVNGKIGTFDISDTNLCKFAFEKHCVFIGYADVNKRFCRKSQWVIPVKVIRCYSILQNALDSLDSCYNQIIFSGD